MDHQEDEYLSGWPEEVDGELLEAVTDGFGALLRYAARSQGLRFPSPAQLLELLRDAECQADEYVEPWDLREPVHIGAGRIGAALAPAAPTHLAAA